MKRILALCFCFVYFFMLTTPVSASATAENGQVVSYQVIEVGNGITCVDEVIEYSNARSTDKTTERKRTFTQDGVVLAVIAFRATFRYDGSTVQVISKTVTQTETFDGWSYKQNSFTASGGTVTLDAKLTKLLIFNQPFTMILSCDKDGNISY